MRESPETGETGAGAAGAKFVDWRIRGRGAAGAAVPAATMRYDCWLSVLCGGTKDRVRCCSMICPWDMKMGGESVVGLWEGCGC
eukprot:1996892-Rhodomonas_salina.1